MTTETRPVPGTTGTFGNGTTPHSVRDMVENHVREHPLKAAAQAAAVGYALRLLPLRSLFVVGTRLAGPVLCLMGLWKACDRLESKARENRRR
jgi:hypothetical protein